MSDLVTRLRRMYVEQGTSYVQEAADRIEALTAENSRLQAKLTESALAYLSASGQAQENWDEVLRLREALLALRLAHEQNKYRDWEKGVPNFKDAEALADAALEVAK